MENCFQSRKKSNYASKKTAAVRKWIRNNKPADAIPSHDLNSYAQAKKPQGTHQFKGLLEAYFETAQKGDLLIIPPGPLAQNTLIAEFSAEPNVINNLELQRFFGPFTIPTRPFKVLSTIEKRKLPSRVLDIISKPNMFVLLDKSERDFFYRRAYGSYLKEDNLFSRFHVTSHDYNTNDDLLILAFFNFIAANTKSVSLDGNKSVKSIREAAFLDLGEFAPELKSNINSPGSLDLIAKNIIPLVASAMFMLAVVVGPEALEAANAEKIILSNSGAGPDDECSAAVHESVLTQLKLLTLDEWSEACEFARRAANDTGLHSNVQVTEEK